VISVFAIFGRHAQPALRYTPHRRDPFPVKDPAVPLGQPGPGQRPARRVHQLDIVMILSRKNI